MLRKTRAIARVGFLEKAPAMPVNVVHAIPGRLRLRVEELRNNEEFARDVQRRLSASAPIRQVIANPATASVLVRYDARQQEAAFASIRTTFPDLDGERLNVTWEPSINGATSSSAVASTVVAALDVANRRVARRTGGLDLKLLIPSALIFLSMVLLALAILRRRVPIPTWYELLWFGFNVFLALNLPLMQKLGTSVSADAPENGE
jgi:hypothetical protein